MRRFVMAIPSRRIDGGWYYTPPSGATRWELCGGRLALGPSVTATGDSSQGSSIGRNPEQLADMWGFWKLTSLAGKPRRTFPQTPVYQANPPRRNRLE